MRKSDREIVFNKFGGKCAYCGCELQKGWHVDHIEPIRRLRKWVDAGYYHKETGERLDMFRLNVPEQELVECYDWKEGKYVDDGCMHEHLDVLDNYMPSCPSCNINKHGDTIEQFRESIAGYLRSLNLRIVQYKMVKKYGLIEETNKPVIFYFELFQNEQSNQNG